MMNAERKTIDDSYNFSSDLFSWINNKKVSRKELITLLQFGDYEEFKGLDNITLSRWLTGKTVPPLYKQFIIAKVLGVDLIDLLIKVDISKLKPTNKLSKVAENLVRLLDFSVTTLSYNKIPDTTFCRIENQNYDEHMRDFGSFHSNISALDDFFANLYKLGDSIQYPAIKLLNGNNDIIGHWTGMSDIEKLGANPFFSFFDSKDLSESSMLSVGFYKSSKHFFELIVYGLCYYLLCLSNKKRYAYIFIAGYPMYEIVKLLLSVEESRYFAPGKHNSKLGVYMMKVDVLKALANPLLLPMVQEKMLCLMECDKRNCNDCNLKALWAK